jgi:predicted SAM-dependent methyltransferase
MRRESEMVKGRVSLAITERDLGSDFAHLAGGEPDLASVAGGTADAVLVENVYGWNPAELTDRLRGVYAAMRAGGLLRLSTPDLDAAVQLYLLGRDGAPGPSRGAMFNEWCRANGAWFLFNEEDLARVVAEAGFVDARRFIAGASSDPLFWGVEDADGTLLVLEARKPRNVA